MMKQASDLFRTLAGVPCRGYPSYLRRTCENEVKSNYKTILYWMEAMYIDHRMGRRRLAHAGLLRELIRIKRFCTKRRISVRVHIESAGDRLHINVSNDAAILVEDLVRIQSVRSTFRVFQRRGNEEQYFLEHINTSGGGRGLGQFRVI